MSQASARAARLLQPCLEPLAHHGHVGLALESDCVVVIVSEETGIISLAVNGALESPIPRERFQARLAQTLEIDTEEALDDSVEPVSDESPTEIARTTAPES